MTSQAEDYTSLVWCGGQNHVPMYGWSVGTPLLSADAFLQLQVRTASLGWQSHSRLGPAGQSKGALSRATAGRDPKANQKCSFAESWARVQPLSAKTLLRCIIHLFIIVYWTCEILLKRRPDNWSSTKPRATSLERNGDLQRMLPFAVVSDHAATIFLSLIVTESTTLQPKQRVSAWGVLPCMLLLMSVQDVSFAHPSTPLPSQFSHDPFQPSFTIEEPLGCGSAWWYLEGQSGVRASDWGQESSCVTPQGVTTLSGTL